MNVAKRIVALDPGGTTGWAATTYDDGSLYMGGGGGRPLQTGQIDCRLLVRGMDEIVRELKNNGLDRDGVLLVEEFILRPGSHSSDALGTWPLRLLGALEYVTFGWGCQYEIQTPAEKSIMTDARLKDKGLWRTPSQNGGPHAMDAVRHLLVWAAKTDRKVVL